VSSCNDERMEFEQQMKIKLAYNALDASGL
jgi:hypothetical protein